MLFECLNQFLILLFGEFKLIFNRYEVLHFLLTSITIRHESIILIVIHEFMAVEILGELVQFICLHNQLWGGFHSND